MSVSRSTDSFEARRPQEAHPQQHRAPAAASLLAARTAAALFLVVATFHAALALGAPWGRFTQGGSTPGTLPTSGRLVATLSCALSLAVAGAVLARVQRGPFREWRPSVRRVLAWATTAYAIVAVGLNLITRSTAERAVWAPVSFVLLALVTFVMVTTTSERRPGKR